MNNKEIDQLVREALDINPSPKQVSELERSWTQLSRKDHRKRVMRSFALAASILIAVSATTWFVLQQPSPEPKLAEQDSPVPGKKIDNLTPSIQPKHVVENQSQQETFPSSAGRPATDYERLAFAIQTGRPISFKKAALKKKPTPSKLLTPAIAAVDTMIKNANQDTADEIELLVTFSETSKKNPEKQLLLRLQKTPDSKEDAILRLLAVCGSHYSIPYVLRCCEDEKLREQALQTCEQIVGTPGLAGLVGQTNEPAIRAALIQRLLTAEDDMALNSFLALVYKSEFRTEALVVADSIPNLPLEKLIELLDDKEKPVRLSAAMVLGYTNGPEVTERLIEVVTKQPSGHSEAWMALLGCRGTQAERFLAYANTRPNYLGHINGARSRMSRMAH